MFRLTEPCYFSLTPRDAKFAVHLQQASVLRMVGWPRPSLLHIVGQL